MYETMIKHFRLRFTVKYSFVNLYLYRESDIYCTIGIRNILIHIRPVAVHLPQYFFLPSPVFFPIFSGIAPVFFLRFVKNENHVLIRISF